jgi:hypothetical protein
MVLRSGRSAEQGVQPALGLAGFAATARGAAFSRIASRANVRIMASRSFVSMCTLATLALAASCSNEVIVTTGSGSTSSSSSASTGGSGGAPSGPREIEIALQGPTADELANILVLLSHEDGSLAASWPAAALPVKVIATDGDLVTYLRKGDSPLADSSRVEEGVDRIDRDYGEVPKDCSAETMHVDLHVPAIDTGSETDAIGSGSGHAHSWTLPADLSLDVGSCDGRSAYVLTTVRGPNGWVGVEYDTLPFAPGTTVSLTPAFASIPRKKVAFDFDEMDGAIQSRGVGWWNLDDWGMLYEPTDNPDVFGDAPFHFEANLVDLPTGRPYVQAWTHFPPPMGCDEWAVIERTGASDSAIPFHVAELGVPTIVGESWQLTGAPGDYVVRLFDSAETNGPIWMLFEDARHPRASVFPTLPSDAADFAFPSESLTLQSISNIDQDFVPDYAAFVADDSFPPAYTVRTRRVDFQCPDP